jgi:hypothetical protein
VKRGASQQQGGYVLLIVIGALAVVALVAGRFAERSDQLRKGVIGFTEYAQATTAASDAKAAALYWMATRPLRPSGRGDGQALLAADGREYRVSNGALLAVQDDRGLLSVNLRDRNAIRNLLIGDGLPVDRAQAWLDVLDDYIDTDSLKRLSGAERALYQELGLGGPRNDWLIGLGELDLMPLWRDDPVRLTRIKRLLTVGRSSQLNPATACPAQVPCSLSCWTACAAIRCCVMGAAPVLQRGLPWTVTTIFSTPARPPGSPSGRLACPGRLSTMLALLQPNLRGRGSSSINIHRSDSSTAMTSTLRLPFLSVWTQADRSSQYALLLRGRFEAAAKRSFGARRVLLARSRYRIKWFRLAGVPSSERFAALGMQARAWTPFDVSSYRLSVRGEEGFVLAWDRASVASDLTAAGLDAERCHLVPESVLRAPGDEGVRLLRCVEGVEGQVWRDGWLRASRWWPEAPGPAEWQLFLHASASEPSACPAPVELPLAARPWAALQDLDSNDVVTADKAFRLLLIGGMAFALAVGFVGRQAWDAWQQTRQREAQIADLRASSTATLHSRDRAMRTLAQGQQWVDWLSAPQPIEVIAALDEALRKSSVLIRELELSGDRLRLGLQLSPQAQRSAVVRDLQAGGWFKNVAEVRAESARALMVVEMRIDGLRPPARSTEPALGSTSKPGEAPAAVTPPPGAFGSKP